MMTCLVYGASGAVGSNIYKSLRMYHFTIGVAFKNHKQGLTYSDACNYKMVEQNILGCEPEIIIFAAGNKNLKASAKEHYQDNVVPIINICKVIHKHKLGTKVIFLSTDYVHTDTDYGRSKLCAERTLGLLKTDHKIIRTASVIGEGSVYFKWLLEELKKTSCNAYNKIFTPTSTELLCNSIIYLIHNWKSTPKIVNIVGKKMTRVDFTIMVRDIVGSKTTVFKYAGGNFPRVLTPSTIIKKIPHKQLKEFLCQILES